MNLVTGIQFFDIHCNICEQNGLLQHTYHFTRFAGWGRPGIAGPLLNFGVNQPRCRG